MGGGSMKKIDRAVKSLFFTSEMETNTTFQFIIFNKKTNTLAFYSGGTLVRTFRVATGRVSTYTPEGTFKIVNKEKIGLIIKRISREVPKIIHSEIAGWAGCEGYIWYDV